MSGRNVQVQAGQSGFALDKGKSLGLFNIVNGSEALSCLHIRVTPLFVLPRRWKRMTDQLSKNGGSHYYFRLSVHCPWLRTPG